jgi:hypothetical protein
LPSRYERTLLLDFGLFAFLIGVTILGIGLFTFSTTGPVGIPVLLVGVAIVAVSIEMIAKFSKKEPSSLTDEPLADDEISVSA